MASGGDASSELARALAQFFEIKCAEAMALVAQLRPPNSWEATNLLLLLASLLLVFRGVDLVVRHQRLLKKIN